MGHVIPKQLGLLKDVEKQVVLLSVLRCHCLSTKRKEVLGDHYYCCSNCQNFLNSAHKILCTQSTILIFFTLFLKENPQAPINELLKRNHSKNACDCCRLLLSVTSQLTQPQKMCKGLAYGINLLENGGLFYKIQPKMCVQLWSLLGRSRCFHSFIRDLLEDVRFCSSWLDLGEEWGRKFLLVHTDHRMYFSVLLHLFHCTYILPRGLPSRDLKASALATC